jgi:orsellinic acid C2-O-methyltransferase
VKRPESLPAAAPQDVDTRGRLLALINAHWTTQTVSVAAQLRLPELLRDGPQTADVLAQATRSHRPSLLRLLRALTSIDVLSEPTDGSFALTSAGTLLRSDVPDSLASWAVLCGTHSWATWGRLADSVRDGESVRKHTSGVDGFNHLENDPEGALLFNRAMVELTRPLAISVAQTIDFSGMSLIVDVGGGYGELITAILASSPSLRGILFDLPHATNAAADRLAAAGVEKRCTIVSGSFFENIPGEADAYLLKSVLHDWNDDAALDILRNCRRAMAPHAKLLVIERIAPEHFSGSLDDQDIARSDLNMLVATGGRERTERQYRSMLDAAELRMTRLLALSGPFSVLEAARR